MPVVTTSTAAQPGNIICIDNLIFYTALINPASKVNTLSALSTHSNRPFTNSLCVFATKTVQLSKLLSQTVLDLKLIQQANVMPNTF